MTCAQLGPERVPQTTSSRCSMLRTRPIASGGSSLLMTGLAWLLATHSSVDAATITWSAAQGVAGDSDVATTGALEYAFNFGTSTVQATTVNGVTFSAFAFPASFGVQTTTVGNVTVTESPGFLTSSASLGGATTSFTNLSSSYQSLLGSGGSASDPFTITVTLAGLTIGTQYSLQWWSSNAAGVSGPFGTDLTTTTAASGANQVTLNSTAGGLGQFVTGTFTADAVSQIFTLQSPVGSNTAPLINALQLRNLGTPSAVPGAGLAGLATLGFAGVSRRRRR